MQIDNRLNLLTNYISNGEKLVKMISSTPELLHSLKESAGNNLHGNFNPMQFFKELNPKNDFNKFIDKSFTPEVKFEIIPEISKDKVDEFNKILSDINSDEYKRFKSIADGAEQAKDSIEEYIAACISAGKNADEKDYKNFSMDMLTEKAHTPSGINEILKKYDELDSKIKERSESYESKGGDERLKELKAQLQAIKGENSNEGVFDNEVLESQNETITQIADTMAEIMTASNNLEQSESTDEDGGGGLPDAIDEAIGEGVSAMLDPEAIENEISELENEREALDQVTNARTSYNNQVVAANRDVADFANSSQEGQRTLTGFGQSLVATKLKAFATTAAMTALNSALSFGLSFAISAAVTYFSKLITKYKDLRESNLELVESFEETSDSIQDQTDKIKELQKVMENENSTNGELYDARADLLEIQRELIDTYGEQAKGIDLVNGKLDEELKKLDEIERKEAEDALHKMSYESYQKDITDIEKKKSFAFDRIKSDDTSETDEFEKMLTSLGFTLKDEVRGSAKEGTSRQALTVLSEKTDEEALDILNELMSYIEDNIPTDSDLYAYRDIISEQINKIDTEEYRAKKTNIENYARTSILSDEEMRPLYKALEAAAADYDEAIKQGDTDLQDTASKRIENLKGQIVNLNIDDEYIREQFDDIVKEIENDLSKQKFKFNIRDNEYILESYKKDLSNFDVLDFRNLEFGNGTDRQIEAFKLVKEQADLYGVSIEDAAEILADLGILYSREADAAKYAAVNYESMLESVESVTDGLDKFTSAQEKAATGTVLSADEVNELIKLYPELVSSVERTSDGYLINAKALSEGRREFIDAEKKSIEADIKKTQSDLKDIEGEITEYQAIIEKYRNDKPETEDEKRELKQAQNRLAERQEDQKEYNLQLEQQKLLYEQMVNPVIDWAEKLGTVSDKMQSISDKYTQLKANAAKTGAISPTDALEFMNEVPDWRKYLDINNGQAEFKSMSDDALMEQVKVDSGYYELQNAINDQYAERTELQEKIAKTSPNSPHDVALLTEMRMKLELLNGTIADSEKDLSDYNEILEQYFKTLEKAPAITKFENDIAELDHKKALGMSEAGWRSEYENIANKYINDIQALADSGDADALSTIWNIEEQLHQNSIDGAQEGFDKQKQIIDNAREDLQISVLEYKEAYAELNELYYAPGTALGNTEDGQQQYKENLREIEKLSGEAYEDIMSRMQSAVDFGKIADPDIVSDISKVFEGQEVPDAVAAVLKKGIETGIWDAADIAEIAPYLSETLLSNSDVLTEAYRNAKEQEKEYTISAFEYEKAELDKQLESGLILSGSYIEDYKKLWEKYYKDKTEFAEEDYQTQRDILEAQKSEIQKQIDALESFSKYKTEPYQDEIDALNDVKDSYDEMMDARLEALEKEKTAIEKQNEEQEKANTLREKYLNLQKASMNNRLVYTGSGNWELRRDEEAYDEAKKEYDEAAGNDPASKIDEAIEKLEEEKNARDKAIEAEITARENAIKEIQKPIDNLVRVLTALTAERYNLDEAFISSLLQSADGTEALEALNRKIGFSQQATASAGITSPEIEMNAETISAITNEASQRNRTAAESTEALKSTDVSSNTKALAENTEAIEKANKTAEKTTSTTAIASELGKNLDAQGYLLGTDGKQVLNDGKPIEALTHSEWAKKHKISEWAPNGKDVNETMTVEQYNKLKNAQKNGIIPASIADIAKISDQDLAKFLSIIQSGKTVTSNKNSSMGMPNTASADVPKQTTNNSSTINLTVNVDGSADEKTVQAMKTEISKTLIEYTDYMTQSMETAFTRQMSK